MPSIVQCDILTENVAAVGDNLLLSALERLSAAPNNHTTPAVRSRNNSGGAAMNAGKREESAVPV